MEINGNNPLIGLKNNVRQLDGSQQHAQAQKSECDRGFGSDRLELSVRSRKVQHLDDWIRSAPDIREAKVEEISRDLHRGTYNVKAEKIAEKIIGGTLLDEVF
ncbi:MAG: flagellar biosynthesis anti-sigma factor FlgM [Acidobacteria bacterium]|nr:flagellar biosynthesis anti-sigma factor FlgM [Acidobacteriota bacterium]